MIELATMMPHRGDEVEAYIKRWRDQARRNSMIWYALDNLLDDYRLHADTGTPLSQRVVEPHSDGWPVFHRPARELTDDDRTEVDEPSRAERWGITEEDFREAGI